MTWSLPLNALFCLLFAANVLTNNVSIISDKICKDDFYNKSLEFKAWLHEYVSGSENEICSGMVISSHYILCINTVKATWSVRGFLLQNHVIRYKLYLL